MVFELLEREALIALAASTAASPVPGPEAEAPHWLDAQRSATATLVVEGATGKS